MPQSRPKASVRPDISMDGLMYPPTIVVDVLVRHGDVRLVFDTFVPYAGCIKYSGADKVGD